MEKIVRIRGSKDPGVKIAILNKVVRTGFWEEVMVEQKSEGGEGLSHVELWEKYIPGRRNNTVEF